MGWRDAIDRMIPEIADGWECGSDVAEYILRLNAPDRIALARELLAGTGWVPAREVEEKFGFGMTDWDDGWNACRLAARLDGEP